MAAGAARSGAWARGRCFYTPCMRRRSSTPVTTWTRRFDIANLKTSAGVELSARVVAGYHFPFDATAGVARGHDGSGTVPDAWTIYLRIGHAF